MWDGSNYFSASLLSFNKLLTKHNYTLVYCDNTGTNAFYINNKFMDKIKLINNAGNIDKIYKLPKYYNGPNGGHRQDPNNRKYITYEEAILI